MSVKINWTKAGIIAVTTTLGGLAGMVVQAIGVPYAGIIGTLIGLGVGAAVEIEQQILTTVP